ncbi:4-hydroxythreonine-4-phosphate dehydrogenase PdxA [Oxynema sp. CENA135]|uniref:4-hydroxythreonine-4-phosphate dehydrogenase PdxA n=1 Tax=Oxynema sp. CENA135 TaxID=984206 RepID=UPI00190ACC0E|nr:4-hydroxythreonine-4-phosphate dehydrogenase PdxA [Oxynema sp. CENA135]MBK4731829.1 4-hydroxythreonine-4-phosphate dehydrogenase PdxA [Oxynema sp. CENA135]
MQLTQNSQIAATLRPRLAVTLGDPAGIGPEVVLKALDDRRTREECEVTVVGSRAIARQLYIQLRKIGDRIADPDDLNFIEIEDEAHNIVLGSPSVSSGAASFAYMEAAIARTLAGEFEAIVTGPIAKTWWKAAGHPYPGQTELLAERAGVSRFGMFFVARSPHNGWTLRTLLATTHIPLRQVPDALTPDLLAWKLDLLLDCLHRDFGLDRPRVAISGLNPHSGENGQLGTEERDWLIPWLEDQRHRHPHAHLDGPVPPDTLWVKPGQAWYGAEVNAHDAYLALYHDQGLIPVKLLAFDKAVNTTIGLPFIRTSPDHGTAFDIAGKGIADPTSMKAALSLAAELGRHRLAAQRG